MPHHWKACLTTIPLFQEENEYLKSEFFPKISQLMQYSTVNTTFAAKGVNHQTKNELLLSLRLTLKYTNTK